MESRQNIYQIPTLRTQTAAIKSSTISQMNLISIWIACTIALGCFVSISMIIAECRTIIFKQNQMHKQQPSPISPRGSSHANPKMARYLHRIEQLVGNRNASRSRSISPIASRIYKPIRANALDSYLKYELTLKIICAVFDKKNEYFKRLFVNELKQNIRGGNKDGKAGAKIQKIYKFVPIEKTECAHLIVDTKISAKMLLSILRNKLRDTLKQSLNQIKAAQLSTSNIVLNTARSGRSMILPITLSHRPSTQNQHKKYVIANVLAKIFYSKKVECFYKTKYYAQIQNQNFNQVQKQLKFNLLSNVVKKIKVRHLSQAYSLLLTNQATLAIQQSEKEIRKQQLRSMLKMRWFMQKCKMLRSVSELGLLHSSRRRNEKAEESVCNPMISTSEHQNATLLETIYEAINKINISLISIIMRRKMQLIKLLTTRYHHRNKGCEKIVQVTTKIQTYNIYSSFTEIQLTSQKMKIQTQSKLQWKGISVLSRIQTYFNYALREPLHLINTFSQTKMMIQANCSNLMRIIQRIQTKRVFIKIATSQFKNSMVEQKSMTVKQNHALPRICHKLYICQLASIFVKLKVHTDRKKTDTKKSKSDFSIDWNTDIKQFIAERVKFNDGLRENYRKFEEMLKIEGKSEEDSFSKYQPRKAVFSPKNKSPYANIFSK